MPRLPEFTKTLDTLRELHERKNVDYATADSPLSNFEFTAFILENAIEHGIPSRYLPYLGHIATKLARIINLLGDDRTPANEPILDTFDDLACYSILMKCEFCEDVANKLRIQSDE